MYKAAEIVGERASRYGKLYRLAWDGYDQTYDTWETVDAVVDSHVTVVNMKVRG